MKENDKWHKGTVAQGDSPPCVMKKRVDERFV